LVDKHAELSKKATTSHETDTTQDESDKMAKLARAQGMNTEIRRGIFIVLMSSDVSRCQFDVGSFDVHFIQDYIDACERLSQMNLTEVQQREIVRVLLHCCGNVRVPRL
jgi:nucleolar MIF4G domain-containing protein 1